ncbi:MAG TPA: hypothetical protein VNO20_02070 [Solirubrobacterales bacterium]|nr:hypothetical protein [Solirubrobacterales bacterium]
MSVVVMEACETMGTASPRKLGESIGAVANSSATHNGDEAEGGNGNASTCIQTVEKKNQPNDRSDRDRE